MNTLDAASMDLAIHVTDTGLRRDVRDETSHAAPPLFGLVSSTSLVVICFRRKRLEQCLHRRYSPLQSTYLFAVPILNQLVHRVGDCLVPIAQIRLLRQSDP